MCGRAGQSELPYIGLEHIESWTGRKIDGEISQSEGLASTYASGDVLFGKLRPYLAKIYLADTPGLVSSEALVIRPSRDISSSFLKYYFLSRDFINTVDSSTYGSKMPRASWNYIGNLPLLIPSAQEQQAIVDFLNHKTAQIDALIAKKQSLLDKLAEQRTALISQAVTKGLDPSVPMKDSGVDWLGKIPKYWHVSKLGYVAKSLQTGPFGSQLHADEYVEDGTPLINPSDISKGKITGNPTITVEDAVVARLSRHKLELGDIVIARRGEMGRAGLVGKGNVGWLCGTGSLRARLKKEVINPEFLLYQFSMRGVSEYLSLQSVGSTMDNLNTSILGRLWVVVPPLHEQNDIISEIQKVSSRIEKMRSSVTSAISKLQEYRSALITNAVTGKIDVRDFCIPTTTVQKEVAHG
ncbi:restriction endonuclease subunit S [Vreelandella aquamarina]|uniref:restriction endonuclease subunit S n=1 Tax=Vreelandella aquamarina TaxID=77097 RepID=UPI0034A03FE5